VPWVALHRCQFEARSNFFRPTLALSQELSNDYPF
jgi:hypothetical protein